MKRAGGINLFLIAAILFPVALYSITITNGKDGDRLGDQLLYYTKLKWICRQKGYQFVLSPFEGSDLFYFSLVETPIGATNLETKIMWERIALSSEDIAYAPTFYYSLPRPKTLQEMEDFKQFRQEMKELIRPINPPTINKKEGVLTIALHVRKGSGKDRPLLSEQLYETELPTVVFNNPRSFVIEEPAFTESTQVTHTRWRHSFQDAIHPYRFPPDQYYIDQIRYIRGQFPNRSIQCWLFTDHVQPELIARLYQKILHDPSITFLYRQRPSSSVNDVVNDLWLMIQCDCLIRPGSHLSLMAEFLGDHYMAISPREYRWDFANKRLTITAVSINTADF